MKLVTYLSAISIAYFTLSGCIAAPKEDSKNGISGVYKHEGMTYEFKGDKCFGTMKGKAVSESKFKVEGNLLYISPNVPDMKKMIRNVWVVWDIKGDKIISKYLVDMDDGTKFYEDQAGKIVLTKQKDEPAGAAQPATKPADKAPEKIIRPIPSKDNPR